MVELALRGQRGVRARDASRARREARPRGLARARARRRRGCRTGSRSGRGGRAPRRRGRRRPARSRRAPARGAGGQHGPAGSQPRSRRRGAGPAERLDRRRRWMGLRHRVRRTRPRPGLRAGCERAGAGYRGLLQHRRSGLEGHAARRRREVRRRREGAREEGPRHDRDRLRQRVRGADRDGRRHATHRQGAGGGRGPPGSLARDRVQHVHRARDRHVDEHAPPEGSGGFRVLAAVPLRPRTERRRRAPVRAGFEEAVDPAEAVHPAGGPLRDARSERSQNAPSGSNAPRKRDVDARWHFYEQIAGVERGPDHEVAPAEEEPS